MISHFIAADAWRSGQLTRILSDYVVEGPEVSVLYQARHNIPAKVKAFIDFLTNVVQDIESQQAQV